MLINYFSQHSNYNNFTITKRALGSSMDPHLETAPNMTHPPRDFASDLKLGRCIYRSNSFTDLFYAREQFCTSKRLTIGSEFRSAES